MSKNQLPFVENVLLIDDEEIDNLINERLLQANYFAKNVSVKTNIPTAINSIYKAIELGENIPNIIFLDLQLPKYDGFYFLLEFKQMRYKYEELKETSIVILSAHINKYPEHLFTSHSFVIDKVNKPLSEIALIHLREKIENKEKVLA